MEARGGRIAAACVALAGWGLVACSGDGGDAGGCGGGSPLLAFDHETTDPDRGTGGGVPEVSVASTDGDVEMVTGSWVAHDATFSPDGDQLVVVKADGDYESAGPRSTALWAMAPDGSDRRSLTPDVPGVIDAGPAWSPDGSSIAFVRAAPDGASYRESITTIPADGGEPTELFSVTHDSLDHPTWSPDGRRIAFVRSTYVDHDSVTTVWAMDADGTDARPLAELRYIESLDWRPDGTTLLAGSEEADRPAHLVDPDTGRAEPLEHSSGTDLATWSPDGTSAYYFRPPDEPSRSSWAVERARVDGNALVDDEAVLTGDDLAGTALADVGLYPGFALAVGPCA